MSACFTVQDIICTGFSIDGYFGVHGFWPQPRVSHPKFPVCCHLLEAANVLLHVGLLRCVLWLGSCSAEVSPTELEPGMKQNWKQGFIASWTVTPTCDLVLPLKTIDHLFQVNPAVRFCNTARICRGGLGLSFEDVVYFITRCTSETLHVKENFYLVLFCL